MKKLLFIGIILTVTVGGGWVVTQTSRLGVATPRYTVVERSGDYEIRDYPQLTIATTGMGEQKELNGSFGRLFRYISGENAGKTRIPMTAPVLMERSGKRGSMSFILPESFGPDAPAGKEDVRISTTPAGRLAVLRFSSNGSSPRDEKAATDRLRAFVAKKGLSASGDFVVAYYDPPWIPTFLRRNEVLIRLQ